MTKEEFRKAYRMARLVRGFERAFIRELGGRPLNTSALPLVDPVARYATFRYSDPLGDSLFSVGSRLQFDRSCPRLPA